MERIIWRSGGRLLGRWLAGLEDDDGLPLVVVEGHGAGQVRGGAAQPRQIVDAPSHDGVDRQAGLEAVGGGELAILDQTDSRF